MFVDSCIGVWLSYETTATVMSHSGGQGGAPDQCSVMIIITPHLRGHWSSLQLATLSRHSRHCYVIHPSLRHCHYPAEAKTVAMCCAVWRWNYFYFSDPNDEQHCLRSHGYLSAHAMNCNGPSSLSYWLARLAGPGFLIDQKLSRKGNIKTQEPVYFTERRQNLHQPVYRLFD